MIRRQYYFASKAAPDHRQPCTCDLWPFPHRKEASCQRVDWRKDWAEECANEARNFEGVENGQS